LRQFDATDPLRVKAVALIRKDVCKTATRKIKCCDLSKEKPGETNITEDINVGVQVCCVTYYKAGVILGWKPEKSLKLSPIHGTP
jgi:hypothetical protein